MRIIDALSTEQCPAVLERHWEFGCGLMVAKNYGQEEISEEGSIALAKVHEHHHAHDKNDRPYWSIEDEIIKVAYEAESYKVEADGTRTIRVYCDCPEAREAQVFQQTFDVVDTEEAYQQLQGKRYA